jgi:hypothetical protein
VQIAGGSLFHLSRQSILEARIITTLRCDSMFDDAQSQMMNFQQQCWASDGNWPF